MIRDNFQVQNHALEQPKLNILTWLKVLNSSTKFGDFKNFGREVRNFDGARRIFYEVKWRIFSILKKMWLITLHQQYVVSIEYNGKSRDRVAPSSPCYWKSNVWMRVLVGNQELRKLDEMEVLNLEEWGQFVQEIWYVEN